MAICFSQMIGIHWNVFNFESWLDGVNSETKATGSPQTKKPFMTPDWSEANREISKLM